MVSVLFTSGLYRRHLDAVGEIITVRRYTGAGPNRPRQDVEVKARVVAFEAKDYVGPILVGDRKIVLLVEDLIAAQFPLPVLTSDRLIVRGKELTIVALDDSTRRVQGVSIALELQVRG